MIKYVNKNVKSPMHVSAVLWDGTDEAYTQIVEMVGDTATVERHTLNNELVILRTNGNRYVPLGFYCVRYRDDLTAGCRPDIFQATYSQVKE